MSNFEFEAEKSVRENIESFLDFMEAKDSCLGKILREEIVRLIPLPEGQRRSEARTEFNAQVAQRLDALSDVEGCNE